MRQATALQLDPSAAERERREAEFVAEALAADTDRGPHTLMLDPTAAASLVAAASLRRSQAARDRRAAGGSTSRSSNSTTASARAQRGPSGPPQPQQQPAHPPAVAAALTQLHAARQQAWALRWENRHKELWWRLPVHGVAMYGMERYAGGLPLPCRCCKGRVSRRHNFWECPIAQHVRKELQRCLPAGSTPLARQHVWLLQAPPEVQPCVWRVVALAALNAMDSGRRHLERLELADEQQRSNYSDAQQSQAEWVRTLPAAGSVPRALPRCAPLNPTGQLHVETAAAAAVEELWAELESFVSLYEQPHSAGGLRPPPGFCAAVAPHPFIVYNRQPAATTAAPAAASPAAPAAAPPPPQMQLAARPPPQQ